MIPTLKRTHSQAELSSSEKGDSSSEKNDSIAKNAKITQGKKIEEIMRVYQRCPVDGRCRSIGKNTFRRFSTSSEMEIFQEGNLIGKGSLGDIFMVKVYGFNPIKQENPLSYKGLLALKTLQSELDSDLTREFFNEYKVLKHFNSSIEGIPKAPYGAIYDKNGKLRSFLMELYENNYEKKLCQSDKKESVCKLTQEFKIISRALASLHANGYMHRDIHAANILYRKNPDGSERLCLADLGRTEMVTSLLTDPDSLDETFYYGYLPIKEGCFFNELPANIENLQDELEELLEEQLGQLTQFENQTRMENLLYAVQKFEELVSISPVTTNIHDTAKLVHQLMEAIVNGTEEFKRRAQAIDIFNLGIIFYRRVYGNDVFPSSDVPFPYEQEQTTNLLKTTHCIVFKTGELNEQVPLKPKDDIYVDIPSSLKDLIHQMIDPIWSNRPPMATVVQQLNELFS